VRPWLERKFDEASSEAECSIAPLNRFGPSSLFEDEVFNLLRDARAKGWLADLVNKAIEVFPRAPALKNVLDQWFMLGDAVVPLIGTSPAAPLPGMVETVIPSVEGIRPAFPPLVRGELKAGIGSGAVDQQADGSIDIGRPRQSNLIEEMMNSARAGGLPAVARASDVDPPPRVPDHERNGKRRRDADMYRISRGP
jgi:hypothetical protein